MEVFVFRHGPAENRDPIRWPNDDDRPLSRAGVEETREAARGFAAVEPDVRRIATSPAERARATAELLAKALELPRRVETWDVLAPDCPASPVLARVADEGKKADRLVLVGHEPILSELVGGAISGECVSVVHLARAGAAALRFEAKVAPGAGELSWLLTRRLLAALAR